nr:OprD family outer membrane porin [Pantoea sp. 201603H]
MFKYIAFALMTCGISSSSWASTDDFLNDDFFKNSQLTLSTKNYWKYLKEENANPKYVHNAWGQGFSADYQSGYFLDVIGFDFAYYSAVKLGASDYFNSRGVLYSHGAGNSKSNAEGYSKFGQRNIKLNYNFLDTQLNARWGWQMLKNYGVISTSNRLSPTTYSGISGSVSYGQVTVRGAWIENSMDRNSPDKKQFRTNTGKDISYLTSGEILWKSDDIDVQYAYGESKNYLQRHQLFTQFRPDSRLKIGAQIYGTHAQDAYRTMPASKRDFDNNAWHFAMDTTWKAERWSSKLGIGYTDAKKTNEVGFYPRHMSKNSRGTFISMAYAGDDYLRDGELMLANITEYRLTPDFAVGLAGNIGQFNYKGNHVRSGEISAFSRWAPSQSYFKNFTFWAMFGPGWSYKTKGKTPVLTDGHYTRTNTLASEVIMEYRFNVL